MKESRRTFIKASTAGAVTALAGFNASSYSRILGANDRVNIAVAGFHNRGIGHIRTFTSLEDVNVTAICDIDQRLFPRAIKEAEESGGEKPATYTDFRKLLEDKNIDAVSIVTPDHWHALQTIWACQAGKDVYIEKPLSYTIEEGRKMVEAARNDR